MKITPVYAAAAVIAVAIIAVAALLLTSGAPPSAPGANVTGVPGAGAAPNETGAAPGTTPGVTPLPGTVTLTLTGNGLFLLAVKDKPMFREFGTVTEITLTVSKITVHFSSSEITAGESNSDEDAVVSGETSPAEGSGWITVFNGTKTFNLLNYTGNISGILGEANLSAGRYEQIRLYVSSSTITVNGVTKPLAIPGNVLKLSNGFIVRDNTTTLLTMDFDANRSIVLEGLEYKLKPVIRLLKDEYAGKDSSETKREKEGEGEELEDVEETRIVTKRAEGFNLITPREWTFDENGLSAEWVSSLDAQNASISYSGACNGTSSFAGQYHFYSGVKYTDHVTCSCIRQAEYAVNVSMAFVSGGASYSENGALIGKCD